MGYGIIGNTCEFGSQVLGSSPNIPTKLHFMDLNYSKFFMQKGLFEFYCNNDEKITTFDDSGYCKECGKHADNVVKWTKEWQPMTKYYEKTMVDIITKDGKQYELLWPNAGFMNGDGGVEIPYSEVDKVRKTNNKRYGEW